MEQSLVKGMQNCENARKIDFVMVNFFCRIQGCGCLFHVRTGKRERQHISSSSKEKHPRKLK